MILVAASTIFKEKQYFIIMSNFFELDILPETIEDGMSLDTVVLEQEIQDHNGGINIADPHQNYVIQEKFLRQFVPHFYNEYTDPTGKEILTIIDRYKDITGPCSILVDSVQDIQDLMTIGYQVAHFHYILGKKHNLKGKFPRGCCGVSSRNVILSLIEMGYPNAAYLYSNNTDDHGYVALPFVFKNKDIQGSVIIDSTSDSLCLDKINTRNDVFIKLGTKWEYTSNGTNLFPIKICAIDTLKEISESIHLVGILDDFYSHENGEEYFKKAFANPLPIPINREQLLI